MNMSISNSILERRPKNYLIATARKIAIYLFFPFAFILIFEAIVKNFILINLANTAISILNTVHDCLYQRIVSAYPRH
ncbi:MAG: hypothetical protein WCF19_06960 [Chlamydiales bacterium]